MVTWPFLKAFVLIYYFIYMAMFCTVSILMQSVSGALSTTLSG